MMVVPANIATATHSSRRSRSHRNTTSAMPKAIGMTRCPKTPSRIAAISPTTAAVTASLTASGGPLSFESFALRVMLFFAINARTQRHEPGRSSGAFGLSEHREPAGAQRLLAHLPQPHRHLAAQIHRDVTAEDQVPRTRFGELRDVGGPP